MASRMARRPSGPSLVGVLAMRPAAEEHGAQAGVVAALSRPEFFGTDSVEHVETHVSHVFLAGDRVLKLKKPVSLPFADLSTLERRRSMCHEEVRLNRRLAPDVYVGVRALVARDGELRVAEADAPDAVEYAVEMRRLDQSTSLAARIERGAATAEDVRAVARRLAEFHARARPVAARRALAGLARSARETFETLLELTPPPMLEAVRAGDRFAAAFLAAHRATLAARAEAGFAVEGHGDLRAEHVFLEGGAVRIIDCAELQPRLHEVDVGADLSFLVMDLELRGRPDLARELVDAYRGAGGDPGPDALIRFHAAQRAWIRAKVALLRAAPDEAGRLASLARRLAWDARAPLMLVVCGPSASGKTTVAEELHAVSSFAVFGSDRVRKGLAGLAPTERGPERLYTDDFNRRTYAELGRLAARELRQGRGAIVDATFRHPADRAAFAQALDGGMRPAFVECRAPRAVSEAWAAARESEPARTSDATAAIAAAQRTEFAPLDEVPAGRHLAVRTDRRTQDVVLAVEAWLDERLASA